MSAATPETMLDIERAIHELCVSYYVLGIPKKPTKRGAQVDFNLVDARLSGVLMEARDEYLLNKEAQG